MRAAWPPPCSGSSRTSSCRSCGRRSSSSPLRACRGWLAKPALSGALFGVLVFLAMRLVVLPLSAFPHPVSFKPLSAGLDLLSHMFLFGLPIALAAARAIRPRTAP